MANFDFVSSALSNYNVDVYYNILKRIYVAIKNPQFRHYEKLTLVNPSNDKSINFPAVIVSRLCDLISINSRIRLSRGLRVYQGDSYVASPIVLL